MSNASVGFSIATEALNFSYSPSPDNSSTSEESLNDYETSTDAVFNAVKLTISGAGILTNFFIIVIIVGFMQVTTKV
jgi:hypothetical protein